MPTSRDIAPTPVGLLEGALGWVFLDRRHLDAALIHRSYCAENPDSVSNERLEFLGDSVLGLAVTDYVYAAYPALPEGELAKLRASVVNAESPEILWGFLRRYQADVTADTNPFLDRLVRHAIVYYQDFVRPTKQYRAPSAMERAALADLAETLRGLDGPADAEILQNLVFEVGKRHAFPELRAWFSCLYQVLLGQMEGPRFGGFVALYGVAETIALIEAALTRDLGPIDPGPIHPGTA